MREFCRRVAIPLLLAALLPIASPAQVPSYLNHQGILTDSNGVVVPNGEYGLEFGIYDAPAAGTLQFQQQLSVNVVGGLYNVLLSDSGQWLLKEAFDDPNRFLRIRIVTSPGGSYDDLVLEPRQQIASVPFAFRSDSAGAGAAFLRGYIDGFRLSKSAARVLQIGEGGCRDAANEYGLFAPSVWTKDLDAEWAPGPGAGGRASAAALAANKWYHVFILLHPASKTIDYGFDDQLDASNLLADAADYTHYRRLGSILTDGSSNITDFVQRGEEFLWYDPPMDEEEDGPGTSQVLVSLSVPPDVSVLANLSFWADFGRDSPTGGAPGTCYVSSPDALNEEPPIQADPDNWASGAPVPQFDGLETSDGSTRRAGQIIVRTNTSRQIRYHCSASRNSYPQVRIVTLGWWDRRGRDE